jgi:ribose transport system substrate-binding protein
MKKLLSLCLCAVLLVSAGVLFLGAERATKDKKKGVHLGVTIMTREHPYFQSHVIAWENIAKKEGVKITILSDEFDPATQKKNIEDLIALGVNGIALAVWEPGLGTSAMKSIVSEGVPAVGLHVNSSEYVAPFVVADNVKAGKIVGVQAAEYWAKKFPKAEPKIGLIYMAGCTACDERVSGFLEGFKSKYKGSYKKVAEVDGAGVRDKALKACEDMLSAHPEINIIFGINDDSALGAISALRNMGRGSSDNELVCGVDASPSAAEELRNPDSAFKLDGGNSPVVMAQTAYETLTDIIAGKKVPPLILHEVSVVTMDNLDDWIENNYPTKY